MASVTQAPEGGRATSGSWTGPAGRPVSHATPHPPRPAPPRPRAWVQKGASSQCLASVTRLTPPLHCAAFEGWVRETWPPRNQCGLAWHANLWITSGSWTLESGLYTSISNSSGQTNSLSFSPSLHLPFPSPPSTPHYIYPQDNLPPRKIA